MFENNKKIVLGVVVLFLAYSIDFLFLHNYESTLLESKAGKLRGRISLSREGREFYEFLGIPYAQAPVEKLRFLSPKPAKPWDGVLDATKYQSKCIQVDLFTQVKGGSEDCLYLNVFSPKTSGVPSLFPVVVYFHGGYFTSGDAKMFGPKYFMDNDVILITVNFRLGSLGFLNAGNKYARGNQGLKDQVMALKWIQENIPYFNGDPQRVTIMGQSSGAAGIHLHMLSKMSTGLFHRAISASGTALSPWTLARNPVQQAKRLAKRLRCPTKKTEAMVACIGQAELQRLVESHRESIHVLHDPISIYKPTIEAINDDEAFLTKDPEQMVKRGEIINPVPWIVGVNADEGALFASVIARNSSMLTTIGKDWEANLQKLLLYDSEDPDVPKKIRKFYFGKFTNDDVFVTRENYGKLSKLFSDRNYNLGAHNSIVAHAKEGKVFAYHFTETVPLSLAEIAWAQFGKLPVVAEMGVFLVYQWVVRLLGQQNSNKEVAHFDDQTFFFNINYLPEYNQGSKEYEFSKDLINLFVSFADKGEPSEFRGVKWSPVVKSIDSAPKYLQISSEPKLVEEPFSDSVKFWNNLYLT